MVEFGYCLEAGYYGSVLEKGLLALLLTFLEVMVWGKGLRNSAIDSGFGRTLDGIGLGKRYRNWVRRLLSLLNALPFSNRTGIEFVSFEERIT